MTIKMTEQSAGQEQQQQQSTTTTQDDVVISRNQHDKNDNDNKNESSVPPVQQQTSCPPPQQQQQQQQRRKLRVLVISMGGERQDIIKKMFSLVTNDFEIPTFIAGIPSRKLRNRNEFFYYANQAGLLPNNEYIALHNASTNPYYEQNPERLYECLADIPIINNNNNSNSKRRGSQYDLQMHYSVELWKKAKTINRGRAVLACTFAHLIALKKLVTEQYDILIEDNVRIPIITSTTTGTDTSTSTSTAADRIWNTINSIQEWEQEQQNQQQQNQHQHQHCKCHVRYFGWLGSVPNLNWIYNSHIPQKQFHRPCGSSSTASSGIDQQQQTIVVFPVTQDIENDLKNKATIDLLSQNNNNNTIVNEVATMASTTTTSSSASSSTTIDKNDKIDKNCNQQQQDEEEQHDINELTKMKSKNKKKQNTTSKDKSQPGGSTVWGTYAYWISNDAYDCILQTLQNDVGAMLWKSKKMKNYLVKPIDKIIPRTIMSNLYSKQQGQQQVQHDDNEETKQQQIQYAVQIATCPSFFRAPMLTSKIHTQWDPEFCKSTTIQLQHTNLVWSDLYLSSNEQQVVQYYEQYKQWISYSDIVPTTTNTTTITSLTNNVATIELDDS